MEIKEIIKEIRGTVQNYRNFEYITDSNLITQLHCAADTIEALYAKLQAANMERSTAYYNGGWIPVSVRQPEQKKMY